MEGSDEVLSVQEVILYASVLDEGTLGTGDQAVELHGKSRS
jgi:hypothetical protein